MLDPARLRRGRVTGSLLMLLGAWGALIPFIGPYFSYAYAPDKAWAYSSGRLWLSVVPGAAAFLGGILVLTSARTAAAGGVLATLGGAWFIVGQEVIADAVGSRSITAGSPVAAVGAPFSPAAYRLLEDVGFFAGVGTVIVFVAALALGKVASSRAAAAAYVDEPLEPAPDFRPVY